MPRIVPSGSLNRGVRACRKCGCTDLDCSGCWQRTGFACYWVEPDLCSACPPDTERTIPKEAG